MAHQATITSLTALQRTIETDQDVFRWFLYLISQAAVKTEIATENNIQQLYTRLKITIFYQQALWALFLVLAFFTYHSKEYLPILLGAVVLLFCFILNQKVKRLVTEISTSMISRDFQKSNFGQQTLFQIGEFYVKKYNVKSLLMMLTSVDMVIRKVLLYAWIIATFINPLGFRNFCLFIIAAYIIVSALINSSLIYNRLK